MRVIELVVAGELKGKGARRSVACDSRIQFSLDLFLHAVVAPILPSFISTAARKVSRSWHADAFGDYYHGL